jgi:hypothetical protein
MTNKQIVYNIQNLISKGTQSDDHSLSDKQVEFIVDYLRGFLVDRDLKRYKNLDRLFSQQIACLPLICVDAAECCDFELGCSILRSKERVPKFMQLSFVGQVDGKPLEEITVSRLYWEQFSRFSSKKIKWFYKDGYVYITNNVLIESIRLVGIFENPRAIEELQACLIEDCVVSEEYEYPLPVKYLNEIMDIIMKREINIYSVAREDKVNDAQEE